MRAPKGGGNRFFMPVLRLNFLGRCAGLDRRWRARELGRSTPLDFHLESSHRDLESTIHHVVAALAIERGVAVKETRLTLRAVAARLLDFEVACEVRAMVVSTTLVVRGRVEIGDDLCARFGALAVEGEGMIAGLAKAALEPRLATLRERVYPLADLKFPGLTVRDVAVSAGDVVRLTVSLAPAK